MGAIILQKGKEMGFRRLKGAKEEYYYFIVNLSSLFYAILSPINLGISFQRGIHELLMKEHG